MLDVTWITNRVALGGAVWDTETMAELARLGITHVIDMQIEFDDTRLAEPFGIAVCWNPTDDDFQPKPAGLFRRGVDFAERALDEPQAKLYVHCAAGVHRGPMMALAILCSTGWELDAALDAIETKRPVAEFPKVYLNSVKEFLQQASTIRT
ncbi:MAG TPA: dual specificity protein phosphatase [Terriglobales bacterium]